MANEEDGVVRSLTADKGYFAIEEIAQIQEFDIRTVIGDANAARRRKEGLAAPLRKAPSSCRLCRQEPVREGAFAQARHAPGTQLRARS